MSLRLWKMADGHCRMPGGSGTVGTKLSAKASGITLVCFNGAQHAAVPGRTEFARSDALALEVKRWLM